MMKFFKRFLSPSAEDVSDALYKKIRSSGAKRAEYTAVTTGKAVEPETNFKALVKNGWRRNELIFACSSRKSSTASQVQLRVRNKRTQKELPDHPIKMLLKQPNPRMSEFEFFASIFIFQDFAGIAHYEKVRSRAGKVVQLWPMRPDWVKPRATTTGVPEIYEYGPNNVTPILIPAENVLSFPLFDPLNEYAGYPPVAVAARTGDLDNALTDYVRLLFQEGGIPPGVLKTSQPIDDTIAQRYRELWRERYGGIGNWLEPAVLGYDLEYQQVGLGVDKIGMDLLDDRNETRICMVMKVPPTVIGALVGLKRAIMNNAREFERDWWVNDLIPMYKSIADNFHNQLVVDFGDDVELFWDFNEVPALLAIYQEKRAWALEAFRGAAITRNQFLEACGEPGLGPRGEVFLMSAAQVEVPSSRILTTTVEDDDEDEDYEDEEKRRQMKALTAFPDVPDVDDRVEVEKKIAKAMKRYFKENLGRVEEQLKGQL